MKATNKSPKSKLFRLPFNWILEFVWNGSCYLFMVELWKGLDTVNDWRSYSITYGVASSWLALINNHKQVYTPWTWAITIIRPHILTWKWMSYDHDKVHDAAWKWYDKHYIKPAKGERLGMRV